MLFAVLVGGARAGTPQPPPQKAALKAIQRAAATHAIDPATAAAARAEVARAANLIRDLPSGRREHVAIALGEFASFSGGLTQPRALALLGELKVNDAFFAKHYAPAPRADVTDEDGLVYRYFAGRCLEFHPLANFGALNARVAAGDTDGAQRLAAALVARGVSRPGGAVVWEYPFPFSGGKPGWSSGMAQAVAAQALARTAELVPDDDTALRRAATAAYRAIPKHLLTSVAAGPWIKLYSFGSLVVLNAQLQAVVSLQSYAEVTGDAEAGALAARMRTAAAATIPRFDSGYWTYYALPGDWSPLDYQQYVVQLLKRLAPTDARFASAATRFAAYAKQPPAFKVMNGSLGALRFWLSKPAAVTATTAAGPTKRLSLSGGWHTLVWSEPKRAGFYGVHVSAVDWAGNRTAFDTLPIVRVPGTASKAAATRGTAAARTAGPPPLAVGAAVADPGQASAVLAAGFRLVRFGVTWPAGAAAPDPGLVVALQRVPSRLGIVVDLYAVPVDDAGRAALAQYVASLVQQVPSIRDVLLAPDTNRRDRGFLCVNARRTAQRARPDRDPGRRGTAHRRRTGTRGDDHRDRSGARCSGRARRTSSASSRRRPPARTSGRRRTCRSSGQRWSRPSATTLRCWSTGRWQRAPPPTSSHAPRACRRCRPSYSTSWSWTSPYWPRPRPLSVAQSSVLVPRPPPTQPRSQSPTPSINRCERGSTSVALATACTSSRS